MEHVVYCDESRHDTGPEAGYMAIGSLWIPRDQKPLINNALKQLRREVGLLGEMKWSKVSNKKFESYCRIVDFFFDQQEMDFRVIVVDHSRVDYDNYHDGDRELGFYKFYYQALVKWINPNDKYLILLDFKQNRGADRYGELRRVIENTFLGADIISDLTVIDSSESSLAQLTDILTGAVAATWSGFEGESPKKKLSDYIAKKLCVTSLRFRSPNPSRQKFNVFAIRLSPNAQ